MRNTNPLIGRLLRGATVALVSLVSLVGSGVEAAAPGIQGPSFSLNAAAGYISQPDGTSVYTFGYGCTSGSTPVFLPSTIGGRCGAMQLPGPTLIVTEGQDITVTLTNNLPKAAGNTSILFPGFAVSASGGAPGVLTQEATNGSTVTYTFSTAGKAGTHAYYSGTQGDLQVEMGLFGALIVLPSTIPAVCNNTSNDQARAADRGNGAHTDFRL